MSKSTRQQQQQRSTKPMQATIAPEADSTENKIVEGASTETKGPEVNTGSETQITEGTGDTVGQGDVSTGVSGDQPADTPVGSSAAVGIGDLDESNKDEPAAIEHYADPTVLYSPFGKDMVARMERYVKMMSPGVPVTPNEVMQQQLYLHGAIMSVLQHNQVEKFQEGMEVLANTIKANPVLFGPRYINRGMENVALSSAQRKRFEMLMFLFPRFLGEDGKGLFNAHAKALLEQFLDMPSVGERTNAWFARRLGIPQ